MINSVLGSCDYTTQSSWVRMRMYTCRTCVRTFACMHACVCKCCRIVADWQPKYWIDYNEGQTMFVIDTKTGTIHFVARVAIAIRSIIRCLPFYTCIGYISIRAACSPAAFQSRHFIYTYLQVWFDNTNSCYQRWNANQIIVEMKYVKRIPCNLKGFEFIDILFFAMARAKPEITHVKGVFFFIPMKPSSIPFYFI